MRLYLNITLYDTPVFEYKGNQYIVHNRVRVECYEATREAIGQKVFGNLAITEKALNDLKETLKGQKFGFYLRPCFLENDILYIWLHIKETVGYKKQNEIVLPFGGFIYAEKKME